MNQLPTTTQEVYDHIVSHLRQQGCRAQQEDGQGGFSCMFRAFLGFGKVLMCAVGCLIPDDEYTPDMENCDLETVLSSLSLKTGRKLWTHQDLLKRFQYVHDQTDINLWEVQFADIAENWNLKYIYPSS